MIEDRSKYYEAIDDNEVVRFESVYYILVEDFVREHFSKTGDILSINEVTK